MKNLVLIVCFLVFCSGSCEKFSFVERFYTIFIINNSAGEIRVLLADEFEAIQYPDTTLPTLKPALEKTRVGYKSYFRSRTPWQENFKKLAADTLSIYFIDNEVYENEPWDSIRVHYKILKRLDLSIEDLEALDFEVSYP